jgi:hypothetical protein
MYNQQVNAQGDMDVVHLQGEVKHIRALLKAGLEALGEEEP